MRTQGKNVMERVISRHTGQRSRVSKRSAPSIFLYHITFLKMLAKNCDNFAFRQRKMQINEDAVLSCAPDLLAAFYDTGKIKKKALKTGEDKQQMKNANKSEDPTYSIFEDDEDDISDISDKEN